MAKALTFKPGKRIVLADIDPRDTEGMDRGEADQRTDYHVAEMIKLSDRLYAENKRSLLLILQGMDTSGKDGTIRHVMKGVNPQNVGVHSFKVPSQDELDHDFLWRIHMHAPPKGSLGIFNRSQYEDVLIVRVHALVPPQVWKPRYEMINAFEKLLVQGGMSVLKVFLHISKDEQRKRLQARINDIEKNWKFSRGDLAERKLWDEYQNAYEDALSKCNTDEAPWHIVPADHKWYRNFVISRLLHETLAEMDPKIPPAEPGLAEIVVE